MPRSERSAAGQVNPTEATTAPRRFDLPVCVLTLWVAVMGALYVRAMAAERGTALVAPLTALAARIGLGSG